MTDTIVSMEHLLAAWRNAQRALDELEPDDQRRREADARVAHARAAYQARVEYLGHARLRDALASA